MLNLKDLEKIIENIIDPNDLFKDKSLKDYHVLLHPDRFINNSSLLRLADKLRIKIDELHDSLNNNKKIISPKKRSYDLIRRINIGDISDIWIGKWENIYYIIKIGRFKNDLLKNEYKNIMKYCKAAGTTHYLDLINTPCESFQVNGKTINVFMYESGYFNLEDLYKKMERLDGVHIAWIFNRLLAGLGLIHRIDIIHGAILPSHILIHPITHCIKIIGWGQNVNNGEVLRNGSSIWKHFYPLEVVNKKPVGPGTDIYMSSMCMAWLNTRLPEPMMKFLKSLQMPGLKMRPDDAWSLQNEWNEILKKVYGEPIYHELIVP
jgi:hypothetical protein